LCELLCATRIVDSLARVLLFLHAAHRVLQIGYSGRKVSDHIHFEIRRGGLSQVHAVNPWAFLPSACCNKTRPEIDVITVVLQRAQSPITTLSSPASAVGPPHRCHRYRQPLVFQCSSELHFPRFILRLRALEYAHVPPVWFLLLRLTLTSTMLIGLSFSGGPVWSVALPLFCLMP
jgi:hypothetical protein